MAPMAADTAHSHISLDGNISALASVIMMTSTRESCQKMQVNSQHRYSISTIKRYDWPIPCVAMITVSKTFFDLTFFVTLENTGNFSV